MHTPDIWSGLVSPRHRLETLLRGGAIMPLGSGGGRLEVLHGRVWLTRSGDLDDHVVETGAALTVPAAGQSLIEAWDDSEPALVAWQPTPFADRLGARVRAMFGRCWDIVDPLRRVEVGVFAANRRAVRGRVRVRPASGRARALLHRRRFCTIAPAPTPASAPMPGREQDPRTMSAPTPASELESLRTKLVAARQALPDRLERSVQLQQILRAWLIGRRERSIGAYWPIKGEFDPLPALYRWSEADSEGEPRRIGLPVADRTTNSLRFHVWYPGCETELDAYDIPKPKGTDQFRPQLLVVPCLGFTDHARIQEVLDVAVILGQLRKNTAAKQI